MFDLRAQGAALATLLLTAAAHAATPGGFPPGTLLPRLDEPAPAAHVAGRPFQIDDAGRVYWVNSWGRIVVDGRQTSWVPDDDRPVFRVSGSGTVVYQDSYGKLRRNGASVGASFHRDHDFRIDDAGRVYWIKDWVGEEIYRNGYATGYEITEGTHWDVSPEGRVSYFDEDERRLHIDGVRQPVNLMPGSFRRDRAGNFYYAVRASHARWRFMRFRPRNDEFEFLAILVRPDLFAFDAAGNLWHADHTRTLFKNLRATGWKASGRFELDAAGNVYSVWNDQVLKNGAPTGYRCEGAFAVTPAGDVLHVTDRDRGSMARNGQALGFRIR